MDHQDLNELRSIDELASYQTEVRNGITQLNLEQAGLPFTDEARDEFAKLTELNDEIDRRVSELVARAKVVERISASTANRETLQFNTSRPGVARGEDIYDLSTIRTSLDDPYGGSQELRDRALRSIDASAFPGNRREGYTSEDLKERTQGLLDQDGPDGSIAKRILLTGSPAYRRAFPKALSGRPRTRDEDEALSRAASLTTTAGGFAVPYTLDPTVILTNNGILNPVRQIARVFTITGNNWLGITSAGVTASYDAEAAEVSDDTPVLAQPSANVEMARAFVPMSIEISEDWGSIQSEMATMFSDAKDRLESTKFLKGLGHTGVEPQGLLVGSNTGTYVTATASVLAVADLYGAENGLGSRFRARATWVGNKAAFQKVRQFDTGGGASLWTQLRFGDPADLMGYPAFEWGDYSSAVTTPTSTVMTLGDFNQFAIIDRVGMSVELINHMFHTSNNLPSGQRGLFAYWRNTSIVLNAAAFKHIRIS